MKNPSPEFAENSEEKEVEKREEEERQKALLEAEYARIRELPHKVVNGIPVALTEEEIEEFNRPDPNHDAIVLEMKKSSLLRSRQEYLKQTDWYAAREADQPNSYPSEIRNKRILARVEINAIEAINKPSQTESFTSDF